MLVRAAGVSTLTRQTGTGTAGVRVRAHISWLAGAGRLANLKATRGIGTVARQTGAAVRSARAKVTFSLAAGRHVRVQVQPTQMRGARSRHRQRHEGYERRRLHERHDGAEWMRLRWMMQLPTWS